MRPRSIVSLSGGMDSSTVAFYAAQHSEIEMAVNFSYGSKHNEYERAAAKKIAKRLGIWLRYVDLPFTEWGCGTNSVLMKQGGDIPEGHYEADTMTQTVVPGRNLIMSSILASIAETVGAQQIYLGVHSGDHAIYPDCRSEFVEALDKTVKASTDGKCVVVAPYLHGNKTSIIRDGLALGVPYKDTRTCYKDQGVACGKCGSCQERLEAFKANGIDDPIEYESRI